MPIKEPAPLADYSIGEEISSSAPLAIAWSPPGLAKHQRCALAALTANLVLSVWSAEGKQQETSSWDRRLIVNNTLAKYFLSSTTEDPSHIASSVGERMRLRTRIRAFTWAPALPNAHPSCTLGSRLSYGQHIVAVCNDDNQLALVAIESPTTSQGADRGWNAEVLTHVSLSPDPESIFSTPSSFADILKQQRHFSQVSWSPWSIQGDQSRSIIIYSTNEDVRARVITYTQKSVKFGDEVVYPGIEMRHSGLMKWCPTVGENALTLALFTASGLIYLKVSTHDASIIERATHDLDGRWDQVSGAVWDAAHRPTPRLHVSSLLSAIQNPTAALEVSSGTLKPLGCPSWRDQIENGASLFSAKNDLKGNVKMKVWGLAASPLEDFIAACHSVHPSDMIEYGSPADRRGTVAVSALLQYRQMRQSFPARNVSAEGVLFTLKKLADNIVEDGDQISSFIEEIVEKLYKMYGPIDSTGISDGITSTTLATEDFNAVLQYVKRMAFFDPNTLRDRYTILASHACTNNSTNDLQRTLIAYRLAAALQGLPDAFSKKAFSAEIRNHHQKMITLIQTLIDPQTSSAEPVQDPHEATHENHVKSSAVAASNPPSTDALIATVQLDLAEVKVDTCDFCSAPIPFTDLTTASCTNEHQFPRCGLSFVAIQAPGITKYCGICNTPFLNEAFVAAQETMKRPEHRIQQDDAGTERQHPEIGNGAPMEVQTNGFQADHEGDIAMEGHASEGRHGAQTSVDTMPEVRGPLLPEEERRELPITYARVLFRACDACVYCGGKFVG